MQNKDFTRDGKEFSKVSQAVRQAKSYLHRQFIGIWQILWRAFQESSNFNTSSIRDKWHRCKSRTKSDRKNFSSIATIRLDEKWWADSMECYLRKVQDLLADVKTPNERRFGEPFKGSTIPFGAVVEHHPISTRDLSRLHHFGKKVLHCIFL